MGGEGKNECGMGMGRGSKVSVRVLRGLRMGMGKRVLRGRRYSNKWHTSLYWVRNRILFLAKIHVDIIVLLYPGKTDISLDVLHASAICNVSTKCGILMY